MSRSTLPLLVFAFATLFALGCSRDGGRALEDIRRWEDSRSIPPDSLDTLLREGDVRIRAAGVRAAGRVGDWANRDAVEDRLLKDDAPVVRAEAAFALGILGDPAAGPALARTLDREPDAEVVGEIVLAIGRLELREATPQLLPLLREGHAHVQEQCAEALALLADSTSVDALLVATESPLESVRWRAAYALEKMPRQIDQSQARLRELLSDTSSLVRRYAIRALGRTGYHAAMGDIATCLRANPNDWQLWSIGCDAIGRLDEAEATGILREALGHASFHVRTGALMAAGLRAERELLPELLDQCKDASVGVRAAAYDAVGSCLEGRATSELLVGLDDESTIVAAACARRLGECDDDRAMVTLLELIRDDEEPILRAAATDGLGRAGERAPIPVLRALSSDDDWVVATIAIDALGTLEINDAVPGLLAEFDRRDGDGRNDVCWQILQTLERIADPAAIPLCRRALESESDARLRLAAASALRALLDEADAAAIRSDERIRREVRPVRRSPKQAPLVVRSHAQRLILDTDRGTIEIELLGEEAPQMVESFATLAESNFFDGLSFHRVVPNFVIQGGDPLGTGWGDPGFTLRSEWNPLRYDRGTVGIAHSGKDTGGCQLFITHSPQPHLNARYTIFGRVVAGMDVVDRIERGDRFSARVQRSPES